MARDSNSQPLQAGDRVSLTGTIVHVFADGDGPAQVQLDVKRDGDVSPTVTLDGCLLTKEAAKAPEPAKADAPAKADDKPTGKK